jgi:inositol phosphorylceramide synthase catalytic subunit
MNTNSPVTHEGVYSAPGILRIILICAGYLFLSHFLIGYRSEQLFLVFFFSSFYFISAPTRRFILAFSIFLIYWIVFDYMKAFPNYLYRPVHIQSLYDAEKKLFGILFNGTRITPNEYWLRNGNTFLDVLTGCFYLTWVPVPLLFAVYLYARNKRQFFYFSLTFFLVNLVGFIIYYAYPAAPPWYVQQHGFEFYPGIPGNTAGLSKFDHFFHAGVFKSIYAKSSNVFAAMPSLHSSYPVIVLYFGLRNKLGPVNILFAIIMAGIWFSAVYNSHHYILDIIAGVGCAIVGIFLFRWLSLNSRIVKKFIDMMVRITSRDNIRDAIN